MISNLFSSVYRNAYHAVPCYIGVEMMFYFYYHNYLVPKANQLVTPAAYRDYGNDRSKLMVRVLHRIEATCNMNQRKDVGNAIHRFLSEWFHVEKNLHHNACENEHLVANFPGLASTPATSPENSDDESSQPSLISPASSYLSSTETESSTNSSEDPPICLYKEDIDVFFSWAFFGKHHITMLPWELQELDKIYDVLKQEANMRFPKKPACPKKRLSQSFHSTEPRCMSLEPVNAMHRPLAVYLFVGLLKLFGNLFLYAIGFQRLVSSTGLVGWHRPARQGNISRAGEVDNRNNLSYMPLLFFHGIAPCGFLFYLPILLLGLATEKERPVFLFENPSISCSMEFSPLSEEQTVDGVAEILDQCLPKSSEGKKANLSVVGHSFGSCVVTWLLASKKFSNIKQVVLLDPVSILLSEPDVMVNFLYAQELDKIRMVASSELFTEYYIRRHFAWYNSELWLDDVDKGCNLLVCLSEKDEIINAGKVRQELDRYSSTVAKKPTTLFWDGVGHGACIYTPSKWKEIKSLMLTQELNIVKGRRKSQRHRRRRQR